MPTPRRGTCGTAKTRAPHRYLTWLATIRWFRRGALQPPSGAPAQQVERDHQPGHAHADQNDLHPCVGSGQRASEPVVLERVHGRPRQGCTRTEDQEALDRHGTGSGQQTGYVADPADEAPHEHPGATLGGKLGSQPGHQRRIAPQATSQPQQQLFASPAPERETHARSRQRAQCAGDDHPHDRQPMVRGGVDGSGDQHGCARQGSPDSLERHHDEHHAQAVVTKQVLYLMGAHVLTVSRSRIRRAGCRRRRARPTRGVAPTP